MPDKFLLLELDQVNAAILLFLTLGSENANKPLIADKFFETFGPGNVIGHTDRPFERFHDYERLLKVLREADDQKYKTIHKGTPFYFLAWTAFDMGIHEKALFYMDAAISEDIRKNPDGWLNESASQFLLLKEPESQPARRVATDFRSRVEAQVNRFNGIAGFPNLSIQDFLERFVEPVVKDINTREKRSVVTAFYSFILEYDELSNQLQLRSAAGGSIEPFVTHLFKGGLIFESLLKHFYKDNTDPSNIIEFKQLGQIFRNSGDFRAHFPDGYVRSGAPNGGYSTKADDLKVDIIDKSSADDLITAFETTAKLRNTTGHKLTWADYFPGNYDRLFEQEVNAILFVIEKNLVPIAGSAAVTPPATPTLAGPAAGCGSVVVDGTNTTSGTLTTTHTRLPYGTETTRSG